MGNKSVKTTSRNADGTPSQIQNNHAGKCSAYQVSGSKIYDGNDVIGTISTKGNHTVANFTKDNHDYNNYSSGYSDDEDDEDEHEYFIDQETLTLSVETFGEDIIYEWINTGCFWTKWEQYLESCCE